MEVLLLHIEEVRALADVGCKSFVKTYRTIGSLDHQQYFAPHTTYYNIEGDYMVKLKLVK